LIYFVTDITSLAPFDLVGKEIALSLLKSQNVRLLQRDRGAQGAHRESIPEEYLELYQNVGGVNERPQGMIFHGSIPEAVGRIQRPDECSTRWNVAFVDWPSDKVPDYFVEGLNIYDEVWVTNFDTLTALSDSGVENLCLLRCPISSALQELSYFGLAIGMWGFPDYLENVVLHLVNQQEIRAFHLVCPDIPYASGMDISSNLCPGMQWANSISIERNLNEPASYWRNLMNRSVHFYDACCFVGGSPWLHFNSRLSKVRFLTKPANRVVKEGYFEGVIPPQTWREPGTEVCSQVTAYPSVNHASREKVDKCLSDRIQILDDNVVPIEVNQEEPKLAVIIPYGNLDPIVLEQTYLKLDWLLDDSDMIIVSEISEFKIKEYEHHVHTESENWNMSLARNQGVKYAKEHGCQFVWFLDIDVTPTKRVITEIKESLKADPTGIYIPRISNEYLNKKHRPGSGLMALSIETIYDLGGFDEGFDIYGSEDVDFLFRAQKKRNQAARELQFMVFHEPHSYRDPDRDAYAKENLERFKMRAQGRDVPLLATGLK
jgi:hypothetical protein